MTIDELASAESLPQTERVHVARLKSGDVIVVEVAGFLNQEGKDSMVAIMGPLFPNNRCVIVEGGTTFKVVSEDAAFTRMRAALQSLLLRYVSIASSGDCGFWDPETEPEVIAAREALS